MLLHYFYIYITIAPCNESDVRLRDGPSKASGRIELCHNGTWGTICSDFWDNIDASILCKQLGYSPYGNCLVLIVTYMNVNQNCHNIIFFQEPLFCPPTILRGFGHTILLILIVVDTKTTCGTVHTMLSSIHTLVHLIMMLQSAAKVTIL